MMGHDELTDAIAKLPPINAALDPRIAPLVHALRRDGFRTFGSCDGHGDPRVTPWVQIEWPELVKPLVIYDGGDIAHTYTSEDDLLNALHLLERLIVWFTARAVLVNASLVFGNYAQEINRFIRVEIFDDLINEAFAW